MAYDTTQRLLNKIENREIVLPEFQREFTWKRKQSRDLLDSLLEGYPIGSLLFWKTQDVPALKNMPDFRPDGRVEVLLDGQQRLTALYMLTKDAIPPYYGEADIEQGKDPRDLYIHLQTLDLGYYKRTMMEPNPCWVRVADCFKPEGVRPKAIAEQLDGDPFETFGLLSDNLSRVQAIVNVQPPVMYVQDDADLRHALTVFDRVNSNGTPLGASDIALAHMCSRWPETRRVFKEKLTALREQGFAFDLTFLIRAMNAVVNGRAEYAVLHDNTEEDLMAGWRALDRLLDYLTNFLRDRAFIYSTGDLNTTNVLIPMLAYLAQNKLAFQSEADRRKLLYWMYAALIQRRYSGSVDQRLERDLNALENEPPIDSLIAVLREDHGDPKVAPANLDSRGVGHPLYNMTQVLIRAHGGVDWSNGLKLSEPRGASYSLQRHHVFPRAVLSAAGYDTGENLIHRKRVNEIANRVPLTREGNTDILAQPPAVYLPQVEQANPGNLKRFMIPMEPALWEVARYEDFLRARRHLIADRVNAYLDGLLAEPVGENGAARGDGRPAAAALARAGESEAVEFKSTLRWHLYAERIDKEMEHAVLKTLAAFLNTDGGTLLIGVSDEGKALDDLLGLDQFASEDRMLLHLTNIIKDRIGTTYMRFMRMAFEPVDGARVLRVDCRPGITPAYVRRDNRERFYVRTGPATSALEPSEMMTYIRERFET